MASLWLKLFTIGLICFNCFARSDQNQETEFVCVSMYKQPALQHSLMKNYQIQTRPSQELLSMLSTPNDNTNPKILLKGAEECPQGQVPVHKPFSPHHRPKTFREFNEHYAILRTFRNSTKRWRGAQALFSINKPRVMKNQYSKAWILLSYIRGNYQTSVQFGVAVHTKLYPDDRPRLTTMWIAGKQQNGCYNALCPGGYIQVHKSIYPGHVYDKISVSGGEQQTIHLSVAEDPVTKNWVLTIGKVMIGYWPRESHMADGASEVYFGGFAGTSLPQALSPPMGTGEFPTKDLNRSSFMKQLKYVLPDYSVVDINSNEVEFYVDVPKCYNVMFLKYVDADSRETLTFGGPGGQCRM